MTQCVCIILAQTLHTFDRNIPLKCNFLDFPLLELKLTKFLMSLFKQKMSFSFKFGSLFSVMRDNISAPFYLKFYMLLTKVAHQSANFQTCHCSHQNLRNSSFHSWNNRSVFFQTRHHSMLLTHEKESIKCKCSNFQLITWKLIKYLKSFFKPRVSFPLNFA